MLYCIRSTAVGFTGCSAVRQPSWLHEFSEFNVAGGWLAGWIRWQCQISDINHHPPSPLLPPPPPLSAVSPFYSPLLLSSCASPSHPASAVDPCQHNSPLLLQFTRCFYLFTFHLPVLPFPSPWFLKLTCTRRAAADRQTVQALLWMASSCTSGGSVRSSVALQTVSIVLRMTHSTLQRMAVSQTDGTTDSTAQTDRLVCRAYRQTAQEWQAEGQIVCDRYSQHRTEADNLPIQKRPATTGHRHQMKDRWVTHTDRQQRACHLRSLPEYDIFFILQSYWVENWDNEPWN